MRPVTPRGCCDGTTERNQFLEHESAVRILLATNPNPLSRCGAADLKVGHLP